MTRCIFAGHLPMWQSQYKEETYCYHCGIQLVRDKSMKWVEASISKQLWTYDAVCFVQAVAELAVGVIVGWIFIYIVFNGI